MSVLSLNLMIVRWPPPNPHFIASRGRLGNADCTRAAGRATDKSVILLSIALAHGAERELNQGE